MYDSSGILESRRDLPPISAVLECLHLKVSVPNHSQFISPVPDCFSWVYGLWLPHIYFPWYTGKTYSQFMKLWHVFSSRNPYKITFKLFQYITSWVIRDHKIRENRSGTGDVTWQWFCVDSLRCKHAKTTGIGCRSRHFFRIPLYWRHTCHSSVISYN